MDAGSGSSSRTDALGKLRVLPKAISEKRRRRKQQKQSETSAGGSLRTLSSDGTSASNLAEDDGDDNDNDDRSLDDRSFGSYESGPEPEGSSGAAVRGSAPQLPSKKSSRASSKNPSRATSQSPSRPGPGSQHPSLLGYLTTASPVIQATHIDPEAQSQSQSPSQSGQPQKSPRISVTNAPDPPADLRAISPPSAAKVASPSRRSRVNNKDLSTKELPSTPPSNSDNNGPSILNTPPTPTNPANPAKASTWRFSTSTADGSPQSRALNSHKRASSASATLGPSKLSNVVTTTLTPPAEGSEGNQSGFFSSMFSAAQSAANNFSTNLQNTNLALGANKGRATPTRPQTPNPQPLPENVPEPSSRAETDEMDQKDSAARTIGSGDLSFSHLGLEEPSSTIASPSSARFGDLENNRARSESAPADTQTSNGEFMPEGAESRPRSLNEPPNVDVIPPPSELDDKLDMSRTGSIKRAHRKRGSSVTTTNTGMNMGAPLSGVVSPVPQPAANLSTPKLTGFAIASKKRNRDFHTIFKSVPDDDYLIEDYSCALQREILAHGRLYVSEGHLCFSSNILGWTTTLVMSFDEIVSVEKRSTALLFKNGLMISTLHAKHVFASFTSRDATYDLIVNIWKLGHPTLTSTLNGVRLEGTGGDKTEKLDAAPSIAGTDEQADSEIEEDSDEDADEFYDEDDGDQADGAELDESTSRSETEKAVTRKASQMTTGNGAVVANGKDGASPPGAADFPGPTTHPPTECGDAATHYDKVVGDDTVPAPLGRVFSLLFGKESANFMTNFLGNDQKCTEVTFDDKKGIGQDNKTRGYTYIKPLNNAIGPKQTKCVITEQLDGLDFEKAVNMTLTTQTPDVPSGNVFAIKTKYCLSWAPNNATRVQVNCTIEWTGKSWIKGPIEKASNEGQAEHCKSLFVFLKNAVSSRQRAGTGATNGGGKTKRKGKKGKATSSTPNAAEKAPAKSSQPNWGLLEPVRPILEPVTDLFKPLFTGNVMYGLLVGLLVSTWFGFGWTPSRSVSSYGPGSMITGPDRLAAYEEMWGREDSELWDWLEERIGLDRLNAEGGNARKKSMSPRTAEEKLRSERMDMKEVEEAMRVTEEKLRVLKDAMGRSSQIPEGAGSGSGTEGV